MAAIVAAADAGSDKYGYRGDLGARSGAIPHEEISEEEWTCINEFRDVYEGCEEIDFSDPYLTYDVLLRFLRARNLDHVRGKKMLSDHMAWRKEWDPDAVRQEHIDTALRSGNWRMMPETKNKVPCIFIDLAKWNPHQYTCAEYVRMVSYFQTLAPKGARVGVHQVVVLFDMKGWALWHGQYFLYIKQLVGLAQDQYPERLANVYIYNAPFIFRATWALISPLVDERTRKKVEFVTDPAKLLEVFDASVLPAQVGGDHVEMYPVPNIDGEPTVEETFWNS